MIKQKAELSNKLSISWLKKHGYLNIGQRYGGIRWSYGLYNKGNSIGFIINIENNGDNYIRLQYMYSNPWMDKKESLDYKIKLISTPCNYGGKRYWFICPINEKGIYCGRRVGTLFSIGKYFGCRHCGNIIYASQIRSGRFRGSSVSIPDIEKAEKDIKRYYYKGKPTRKYKRLLRLKESLNKSFLLMAARIDKRFMKFIKLAPKHK